MQITHVIQSLDPAGGGPPQVAARLAAAQSRAGHKVALVSFGTPGRESHIQNSLAAVPDLSRLELISLAPPANLLQQLTAKHVRNELQLLIKHTDVLHLHGLWDTLLRTAASIASKQNTPYVIRPAGMLDPWSMSQKSGKKRLAMALYYKNMINKALFIHALNDDEAQLIGPQGFTCPVVVGANGVFLEEIEPLPEPGAFRNKHPELENHPYILFMARLHYKKGLDYLADGFQLLAQSGSDAHLVVAGPDEGARHDFERKIAEYGLSERVHIVGPIYGITKYAALRDAACFCLPSRQEGFSVAITEALACGLPCVISQQCHFPEVEQSQAGRIVKLEAQHLGQALIEVMSDEVLRKRMGENGRILVERRYTWPAIALHIVKSYQHFMK